MRASEEWPNVPLPDVLDFQEGPGIMARDFRPHGVPLIRLAGLKRGAPLLAGCDYLDEEQVSRRWDHFRLEQDDVLLSTSASLGETATVDGAGIGAIAYTGIIRFRPKSDEILSRFIPHALTAPSFKRQVDAMGVGSVIKHFGPTHLRQMTVCVPPIQEQQAIAEVLGALDDKIAVNERIAETTADLCRAMMQRLWKQGGVSSVTTDQVLRTPNWTRTTLGELCAKGGGSIQTGPFGSQLHASDYVETGIPSVMPQNIGENVIVEKGIARITNADALRLSKYLLAEGDVVYSRRGDVKRRALVRRHESGWLCGTGCLRVRAGNAVEPLFLSHYLGEPAVQNWIQQHAVGATMPNLNTSILGAVPVILPAGDVRSRINDEFIALDARSISAVGENKTLTALRDTLLPQLVTGKLRIKDAERVVEDAV
ncbi:restriction endonuclease subunit S [Streptomyces canus]|uniref:restriction endonuclease subunit S n=1 Tax=Streptomyces canus TaxID=58343 RepID=UPI0036795D66